MICRAALVDREIELDDGRITYDGPGRATRSRRRAGEPAVTVRRSRPTASGDARPARDERREPELTFLRLVPGDSPVHRLWAGTKLLVAAELALVGFDRADVVDARCRSRASC